MRFMYWITVNGYMMLVTWNRCTSADGIPNYWLAL
jgi:hypothetical protein